MRREWLEKDYYGALGIGRDASDKDIKMAYRKLTQRYHPDTNPDDAAAEEKFKEITEAYDVLGNHDKRREYDETRDAFSRGEFVGGPGGRAQYVRMEDMGDFFSGDVSDLLGGLFGGSGRGAVKGRDLSTDLHLTFHEAISGVTKTVTGASGPVKAKIPPGVSDGTTIRLRGKGSPGSNGAPSGDLFVRIQVAGHPIFGRSGRNLRVTVPITYAEAALGGEIDVPTLDGQVKLRIPPGTTTGKTFRIRSKGVASGGNTGDLLATVEVTVPNELSSQEAELLERLREYDKQRNPRAHLGV